MKKRTWSIFLTAALVAGVFAAAPAKAAPEVPEAPNIVDPPGDANYLNDGTFLGQGGKNNATGEDVSTVADLLAVWFTNTAETISVHVQTEAPPPSSGAAYYSEVASNLNDAGDACVLFEYIVAAPTFQADSYATVSDECAASEPVEGELLVEEGPDGTGIVTVTVPRSANPAFADGGVLAAPQARVTNATGPVPDGVPEVGGAFLIYPVIDNTEPGTDYTITTGTAGGPVDPPQEEPKQPKPKKCKKGSKKKACKKGKGGKGPGTAVCAPVTPAEAGAEKPTVVVTDEASEEKPVVQTVTLAQSLTEGILPDVSDISYDYFNVQVDTDNPDAGLYVLFEFPERRDYDVSLMYPDGSYGARSRAWNTIIELNDQDPPGLSVTGHGGEATASSEKIVGIRTPDCGGWTVETANAFGEGGDFEIKVWLGEVVNEPQAPGEETP